MITHRITVENAHAHLFRVTLTLQQPAAQQRLSMAAWIPGSYLVREFARHVSHLTASQGKRNVPLQQLDKATWLASCSGKSALVVTYLVYAFDTSVRAAFLNAQRGFFNGTGVFLRVEGCEADAQQVVLPALPKGWKAATAMPAVKVDASGRGTYQAENYDALVDHPFELGDFWRGQFTAQGVPHEFVVAGALPDFDGTRLLADAKRICETEIKFWHAKALGKNKPAHQRYVFMLNAVEDGYGGLEHRDSTALIAARRDLPQVGSDVNVPLTDGYVILLGLISHEYFHTWNVKRLKPSEFAPYNYTQENYTELLWFFEGFTSYYDDLLLLRAGLIDEARYFSLLGKTVSGVLATPGRKTQSVAQSSFDAWVKYYRADENTPNATVSYYTKGSLVALALDLTLRASSAGSLDAVMRLLWLRSGAALAVKLGQGGITEVDVLSALHEVAGRSLAAEFQAWVHGTDDLPLVALLKSVGVDFKPQAATMAQRLGLRVSESALTGSRVTHVLRGGVAEQAGFSAGDELLALDGWRLRRLDDALRLAQPGKKGSFMVARDQRVIQLQAMWPTAAAAGTLGGVNLVVDAKPEPAALALRKAWLAG
ncbi:MAG: M61 family metallopeptidase [Pseudorhodobacter sp.]|nr:M61 family metallopeptidase [Rhizobacter sp.]